MRNDLPEVQSSNINPFNDTYGHSDSGYFITPENRLYQPPQVQKMSIGGFLIGVLIFGFFVFCAVIGNQ